MISSRESHEFVPFGRQYCQEHPGSHNFQVQGPGIAKTTDHGLPIVKALKDISIRDNVKKDSWRIRNCGDGSKTSEELYINENTVVWSRGSVHGSGIVIKSYSVDSPVQDAFWCCFPLPEDNPDCAPSLPTGSPPVNFKLQKGVCILETSAVSIFTTDGKDYVTSLPFLIAKAWPIQHGLLFERTVTEPMRDIAKTPKRDSMQPNLPVLFSMLHPLDEVAPVVCKTGGPASNSKVSFVTEPSQQIVFACEKLSIVMTYDKILGVHSIWNVRRVKAEEASSVCGGSMMLDMLNHEDTPGVSSISCSGLSRFTLSSQSPSGLSPFRSYSSRVNSPSASGLSSRLNSPSVSRIVALSRSQSPSIVAGSMYRLDTPSPQVKSSPAGFSRTPLSLHTTSCVDQSMSEYVEPLAPDVCLDFIWTESGTVTKDGISAATKVFIVSDLCGQKFLSYLVSPLHSLRCVKFEESNDRSQLIFGTLTFIQARDAAPMNDLKMTLVLDVNFNAILYSGITKMSQVHMTGLPSSVSLHLPMPPSFTPGHPFGTPHRLSGGIFTSSRPASAIDARFDEEVQCLSPVPTEANTSEMLETSGGEDFSFQSQTSSLGNILSLRDPLHNHITLELVDGSLHRTSLPTMADSSVVILCLEALRQLLPRETAMQLLTHWYSTHNAPGSLNGQSEWTQFAKCLLGLMGYDINRLPLVDQCDGDSSLSPVVAPKKLKPSDQGADEDWKYLLSCSHHQMVTTTQSHLLGLESTMQTATNNEGSHQATLDRNAPLFGHAPTVLFALHLVYEEMKLDATHVQNLWDVASVLALMASDLSLEFYTSHYGRDYPQLMKYCFMPSSISQESLNKMNTPSFMTEEPPSIYGWLLNYLNSKPISPFPCLQTVSRKTKATIVLYVALKEENLTESVLQKYLKRLSIVGHRMSALPMDLNLDRLTGSKYEKAVLAMTQLGVSLKDDLMFGISIPLKEVIFKCRQNPPSNWPTEAYVLIGREDLSHQQVRKRVGQGCRNENHSSKKEDEDGMEYVDSELLRLRFSDDLRVREVRRLLQSTHPVKIALTQKPEVSDHDFIEEQEKFLFATCIRTMALPMGRGMFTLCTYQPVLTETLPIPRLCLTGRAPPRNTTVDLSHIDTPPNMSAWPTFHNGVAAGLRIANSSQIDSTWIIYNKPRSNELTNEHAGFLMGLGMNGHLLNLATLSVHDYLLKGHEMTSVGLLLGVAAGKRGSMDVNTTRLLSIHVAALLPPTSTELDVPHTVQVAAMLGVGMVYQQTAHRHMSEVMLNEIGRPPGPEMENCLDREAYSLAAGLALGMIMFGQGSEVVGLSDLSMADQLYNYMVGGHKRPLTGANKERYKSPSYQIKEGDSVNVDVASPGATLALGMMYFKTGNSAVAEWLTAPDTQFLLDFVRPDFLMLRVLSRGLVMWNEIQPTNEWVESNIPDIVKKYAFRKAMHRDDPDCDIDFETMSQAFCNIVSGSCLAMALRYAGTANESAQKCLMSRAMRGLKLLSRPVLVEQAGRSTVENCLITVVLSLAIVMAGTGDLEVLRLCRYLRARVGPTYNYVLYGSHMAISMSLGLLFLGGGRYTLSTNAKSIAAMLCAFFPKFPIHSNDNRYHLQAFRHLYVLAARPRVLLPRDVDSGFPCYVPLHIKLKENKIYKERSQHCMAPCVLPELHLITEIKVLGPRYWPVVFEIGKNWKALKNILKGNTELFVKQRAGHLSYKEDPKGYHSVLAQSLTEDQSLGKVVQAEDIKSFSSDPQLLAFAEYFCQAQHEQEYHVRQYLARVLYECVSHEKPEVLTTHVALEQVISTLVNKAQPLALWQLILMKAYYNNPDLHQQLEPVDTSQGDADNSSSRTKHTRLISSELLTTAMTKVEQWLQQWQNRHEETLVNYLSGKEVTTQEASTLACYLTWNCLPHPSQFSSLSYSGVPTFGELYVLLQPYGLSVSSVMTLQNVLVSKSNNS